MSVNILLPDGSSKSYPQGVSPQMVAEDISPRLAKAAVAAEVDGQVCDLSIALGAGEHRVRILTDRDEPALEVLRHTAAHVLAQAMIRLYGPGVQYTIGPALMDDFQYGFYYDFDLPEPIGQEDLEKVEAEMRRVIQEQVPTRRREMSPGEAIALMEKLGQRYKIELIEDLVRDEKVQQVSLYEQGDFTDLCRGPHLPHTGMVKAFKLLAVAGAYWRGSEKNKMLTRVYGVAFFDEKRLAEHLTRIEEARKRDHRVLGKQLGLFLISDAVGPGLPLWLPKGTRIRMELEGWLRGELLKRGYQPVITPHIGRLDLYRTSGHYPYYQESQFPPLVERETLEKLAGEGCSCVELQQRMERGEVDGYLLKPMNCPHHIQVYKAAQRSYRDLPVRLSEFGTVYRYEQSGELNGLTRVRGFTQDDAHIFCTPEQLEGEIQSCVELTKLVLATLGLSDYRVRISLGDRSSDKYVGDPEHWALAEENIRSVVKKLGLSYVEAAGEAAFYGPKIDFMVKDCLGREWQLGTIQVDYNLPERFALEYIAADNAPHRPVMVHRAPLGSPERFIGILIEHFGGAFPLWLAPVQVAVLPVSEKVADYAASVHRRLSEAGLRSEFDDSSEKIGAKIRRSTLDKVPYMAVIGPREQEAGAVSVRSRSAGELGAKPLDDLVAGLRLEVDSKGASPLSGAPGA
ncbi:MAG: Threonine--tRNA ligase [Planctomycetes bacterium ADurb.Bin126]|nr:MAG: Threonine--tRNA ligase [Planctomycetes bacterium ADurb.Bin126]HOD84471.1 threonine--tRNA ligase [Phycisphaerae bacterium]HQL75732.1 threonine--tRNA ligase [Phycisphaerae bacterium]